MRGRKGGFRWIGTLTSRLVSTVRNSLSSMGRRIGGEMKFKGEGQLIWEEVSR
jgi:hypothetical protein